MRLIRSFFEPLLSIARRFSVRSWLLLFLGPMYLGSVERFLGLLTRAEIISWAVLGLFVFGSFIADTKRSTTAGRILTIVVLAWTAVLLALNIVNVPKSEYHDEVLLTEAALDGIVEGINPYDRDYRGTIVDTWMGHRSFASYVDGIYPGWEHYVYFPGLLIASFPVYAIVKHGTGWYDQRIVYLFFYIALMVVFWKSIRVSPVREPLMIGFFLSPFFSMLFIGFNDIVMIAFLLLAGVSLRSHRPFLTTALYALALTSKQSAVVTLPFFLPLLMHHARRSGASVSRVVGFGLGIMAIVILPFFLWGPSSFLDDTVRFFFGTSYPATGEGISSLLTQIGVLHTGDPFPFWILQFIVTLPLVVVLWRWFQKSPNGHRALLGSSIALASTWFFSRYFLPHHVAVIILLVIGSFVVAEAERLRA